jgi:high mobility group protein B2
MAKDKNKPKGAKSAYICFVEDTRKKAKSTVNFTEFSKECSEKWKGMSPKDKKRYEELAATDRARFDKEMESYTPDASAKGKRGVKRKKDPNQPKRSWSAFFFFSDEFRPVIRKQHPDWKVGDIAKELGRRWDECKNKEKYEQKAAVDRERYEKEMKQYKAGGIKSSKKARGDAGPSHAASDEPDDDDDEEEEDDDE